MLPHSKIQWAISVGRAKKVLEEENKKKVVIEAKDELALNEVWNILKIASPKRLNINKELNSALEKFDNQLREVGNENIIQKAIDPNLPPPAEDFEEYSALGPS